MPLDHDSAREYDEEDEVGVEGVELGLILHYLLLLLNELVAGLLHKDLLLAGRLLGLLAIGLLRALGVVVGTGLHHDEGATLERLVHVALEAVHGGAVACLAVSHHGRSAASDNLVVLGVEGRGVHLELVLVDGVGRLVEVLVVDGRLLLHVQLGHGLAGLSGFVVLVEGGQVLRAHVLGLALVHAHRDGKVLVLRGLVRLGSVQGGHICTGHRVLPHAELRGQRGGTRDEGSLASCGRSSGKASARQVGAVDS
mmetsp:Transcript_10078/g.16996  ORF Transcript_10078/g.16996 Transcript_10078/m.16996 type:complete len:254 (-) Transcript_10078:26-787(-)